MPTAHSGGTSGVHGIAGSNVVVVVAMHPHALPSVTQPCPGGQSLPAAQSGGASESHGTGAINVVDVVEEVT